MCKTSPLFFEVAEKRQEQMGLWNSFLFCPVDCAPRHIISQTLHQPKSYFYYTNEKGDLHPLDFFVTAGIWSVHTHSHGCCANQPPDGLWLRLFCLTKKHFSRLVA